MDGISASVAAPVFTGTGTAIAQPRNVGEAAKQFEALLLGQMLKLARGDEAGWLGSGEDASASSAIEMAEQFLAQSLADKGGLGLAKMVEKGLEKP